MVVGEAAVGGLVLFRQDFDGGEVRGEAGAVELVPLLAVIALGDEDAAVARGRARRGWRSTPGSSSISWSAMDWAKRDDAVVLLGVTGGR